MQGELRNVGRVLLAVCVLCTLVAAPAWAEDEPAPAEAVDDADHIVISMDPKGEVPDPAIPPPAPGVWRESYVDTAPARVGLPRSWGIPRYTNDRAVCRSACVRRVGCRWPRDWTRRYRPSVPIPENRSAWTSLAVAPNAFLLSSGEAGTPECGGIGLHWTRLSDERTLTDFQDRLWASDGEVQFITLEYVSKRLDARVGGLRFPIHVTGAVQLTSLHTAIWDTTRNWVEENLLGAEQGVLDSHDIGGRELEITPDGGSAVELLDTMPNVRFKLGAKFPLPSFCLGRRAYFQWSTSLGLTTPTFGDHRESGNRRFIPDLTLAYSLTLTRRWRIVGATSVQAPGSSEVFDDLGISTLPVIGSTYLSGEFWVSPAFMISLGVSGQTAYLEGTGLGMDLASAYVNLGLLWRMNRKFALYTVFSENPDRGINTTGAAVDSSDSQKDADFSIALGLRFAM